MVAIIPAATEPRTKNSQRAVASGPIVDEIAVSIDQDVLDTHGCQEDFIAHLSVSIQAIVCGSSENVCGLRTERRGSSSGPMVTKLIARISKRVTFILKRYNAWVLDQEHQSGADRMSGYC